MRTVIENVCLQFNAGLIESDGEEDHVHLLILYPPELSVADPVFQLKGTSSFIILSRNYPYVKSQLWVMLYALSYFASSYGGAPISVIRQYIEQRKTSD